MLPNILHPIHDYAAEDLLYGSLVLVDSKWGFVGSWVLSVSISGTDLPLASNLRPASCGFHSYLPVCGLQIEVIDWSLSF